MEGKCIKCKNLNYNNCLCQLYPLNLINNNIRIIILQHNKEFNQNKLNISSVPLLSNILNNYISYNINNKNWIKNEYNQNKNCIVLYPSESSISITEYLNNNNRIPDSIFIIDGSWLQYKNVFIIHQNFNHIVFNMLDLV